MKNCNKCKSDKPLSEFSADKRTKDGLYYCCKVCRQLNRKDKGYNKKYRSKHRTKNRQKVRAYQVWFMYKLSEETYLAMLAKGCEICGSMENLCVDHDHSCCSGKSSCGKCVRGMLCRSCNQAEGFLKSNPELARKLADYLER